MKFHNNRLYYANSYEKKIYVGVLEKISYGRKIYVGLFDKPSHAANIKTVTSMGDNILTVNITCFGLLDEKLYVYQAGKILVFNVETKLLITVIPVDYDFVLEDMKVHDDGIYLLTYTPSERIIFIIDIKTEEIIKKIKYQSINVNLRANKFEIIKNNIIVADHNNKCFTLIDKISGEIIRRYAAKIPSATTQLFHHKDKLYLCHSMNGLNIYTIS
jgi:hypothetical protein